MKIVSAATEALHALSKLSYRDSTLLVSLETISKETRIPRPRLRLLFHRLLRAKIIHSRPGNQGGYCLIKKPTEITLLDIVLAVDIYNSLKPVHPALSSAEQKVNAHFSTITLAEAWAMEQLTAGHQAPADTPDDSSLSR